MYFAASMHFISCGRTSFPEKEMVVLFCSSHLHRQHPYGRIAVKKYVPHIVKLLFHDPLHDIVKRLNVKRFRTSEWNGAATSWMIFLIHFAAALYHITRTKVLPCHVCIHAPMLPLLRYTSHIGDHQNYTHRQWSHLLFASSPDTHICDYSSC